MSRLTQGLGTLALVSILSVLTGCFDSDSNGNPTIVAAAAESCMGCHNGALHDDYAGTGLENPHPFPGAATLRCTTCHGGNGQGSGVSDSHIPPPPEIGDEVNLTNNRLAYFNRLTLTGIDKFADYQVNGVTYTATDYLQFINPGDLRVVTQQRGCGSCHASHAECVAKSALATEVGILSSSMFTLGLPNQVPENQGLYFDTASDFAFRAVQDANFDFNTASFGAVGRLLEFPVYSRRGGTGPLDMDENPLYDSTQLANYLQADNSVVPNSPLANVFHEQVAFTCGDCHLGSAGANNRYGDYRSSGCTACHMRYSLDGRSYSTDPNIRKNEPLDPDDIDPPERPHVRRHMITSVAQTLATGEQVQGIDDYTCAGCHQGSNRTVMQFWGIRLDQNADLRNRVQYPANPSFFRNTFGDTRLFDPVVNNRTFNGRNANQYILIEDYDGDGLDDTPADVHYDAGMGCIDCHGSHDLHGGTIGTDGEIVSRQEQAVSIACEDCHGTVDAYAQTTTGITYSGQPAEVGVDSEGNSMRHVTLESDGNYYLTSRLTGNRHFIPQTRDTVVDTGRVDPFNGEAVYSERASYSMGRADGDPSTGIGPQQVTPGAVGAGFSHMDNMSCVSCHASWTNNCIGCHLGGEYNRGNNFSNITGEQIVFRQANADFVYQNPVHFQLGVNVHNKISPITANTTTFFQYRDLNDVDSQVFAFSDRNGNGNNPGVNGRNVFGALSHNVMMPHSIRGKVGGGAEGPRYCVACHLTTQSLSGGQGALYDAFRQAMATNDFAALDFDLLRTHIGQNPGNQLNSPYWVHMVAGLGSGLYLFDQNGCPVNPLDNDNNRIGCNDAPATIFNLGNVVYNLDRIVEQSGVSNGSNNHALLQPGVGPNLRDGSLDPNFSGPLGSTLINRLTDPNTGIVLDSWLNADSAVEGGASTFVTP